MFTRFADRTKKLEQITDVFKRLLVAKNRLGRSAMEACKHLEATKLVEQRKLQAT